MYRPNEKNASCPDCQNIARELNEAFAEARAQTQPAADALYALIGGDEEDARRAEQLVPTYAYQAMPLKPRTPSRLSRAVHSRFQHHARTGHKLERISNSQQP